MLPTIDLASPLAEAQWQMACEQPDLPSQSAPRPAWSLQATTLLGVDSERLGSGTCRWLCRVERYYCEAMDVSPHW